MQSETALSADAPDCFAQGFSLVCCRKWGGSETERQDGGHAAMGGDVQRAEVRRGKDYCFFKKCGVD